MGIWNIRKDWIMKDRISDNIKLVYGFIAFNNFEEMETWFKKLAEKRGKKIVGNSMTDDHFDVTGDDQLYYGAIKNWVYTFGIENIFFKKSGFDDGYLNEFYIDVHGIKYNASVAFKKANVSIDVGLLRILYDQQIKEVV